MKPENPYKTTEHFVDGFDSGFAAATKYWDEPCTEHTGWHQEYDIDIEHTFNHRILCPLCRKEGCLE
jgi:hypothetical protein